MHCFHNLWFVDDFNEGFLQLKSLFTENASSQYESTQDGELNLNQFYPPFRFVLSYIFVFT